MERVNGDLRERFVDSKGVRIHVVEQGPEDGPPVLLLHGFPEFWWSWRHLMDDLAAAGHRAVAMELRGFGDSDKPEKVEDYSVVHSLGDVEAVLDTVGESAFVVCHDWGAALGWVYSSLAPNRVRGLAALNGPHPTALAKAGRSLTQRQASWYMLLFQFEGLAEEVLSRNNYELLRSWFYGTARVRLPDDVVDRYVEVVSRPGALTAGLNWYRANTPPEVLFAAERPELPPVSCPVLVIWGVEDPYLTLEVGRGAAEYVSGPFAMQELPDTGHWVQQERPKEVGRLVLDFIETEW